MRKRLFQFGTAQPFFPPSLAGNFGFGTAALIQTPNFPCPEADAKIIIFITYFSSSFTETIILLLFNFFGWN